MDSTARYQLCITYAGESVATQIRLAADGQWEIHGRRRKDFPARPVEFDIAPVPVQLEMEKAFPRSDNGESA